MFRGDEPLSHGLLDEATMERGARETLKELNVTTVRSIRQQVASLSGGQRQSVGVAQTAMVLGLIKTLSERGTAVLLISHNLNDVFEVADRIAVLYLGRLVVEGEAGGFDRQNLVEYMTTGEATRPTQAP